MSRYVLHTAETAHWHALINAAQAAAGCELTEALENYLVFTLMRFVGQPDQSGHWPSSKVMQNSAWTRDDLQHVADQCLLFSGLFPDHAARCSIPVTYFVELGQRAYRELAMVSRDELFKHLSEGFVQLMDVLQNMRDIDDGQRCLDPLLAHELWSETGSQHAYNVLRETTPATPWSGTSHQIH